MAVLKHLTGDLAGTVVDLKKDVTVIGRLPECDIILAINGVSRRHAEIRKVGTNFVVVDLDSRNKTLVNGTELKGGVEHLLKENDSINICNIEFVFNGDLAPKPIGSTPAGDVMEITETGGGANLDFRTLEASRSSAMTIAVRPEVKLKAILEITHSLSTGVAHRRRRAQDSRLTHGDLSWRRAALSDAARSRDKAAGPQGFQAPDPEAYLFQSGCAGGRGAHEHQPVDR